MTVLDFSAMVDDNFVDSRLVEYRIRGGITEPEGRLVAAVLIDILGDGISMIYSFYDPDEAKRSLGTFMILDNIARVRRLGLPYLYLGYWVRNSAQDGLQVPLPAAGAPDGGRLERCTARRRLTLSSSFADEVA